MIVATGLPGFEWMEYQTLQAVWNRLSEAVQHQWQQLPPEQQWLVAGTAVTIFALAALYWTPLGNRAAVSKCLFLALALHILAWGYAVQLDVDGPRETVAQTRRVSITLVDRQKRTENVFEPLNSMRTADIVAPNDLEFDREPSAPERSLESDLASPPARPTDTPADASPTTVSRAEAIPDLLGALSPEDALRQQLNNSAPASDPGFTFERTTEPMRKQATSTLPTPGPTGENADATADPLAVLRRSSQAPSVSLQPLTIPPENVKPKPSSASTLDLRADPLTVQRTSPSTNPMRRPQQREVPIDPLSVSAATSAPANSTAPSLSRENGLPSTNSPVPFLPTEAVTESGSAAGTAGAGGGNPGIAVARGTGLDDPGMTFQRSTGNLPIRRSATGGGSDSDAIGRLLGKGPAAKGVEPILGGGGGGTGPALPWQNRTVANRLDLVFQFGGSVKTEKAVEDALRWLARHQHPDGFWDSDRFFDQCPDGDFCSGPAVEVGSDTGLTGLTLLAFLGAGHVHNREGEFARVVRKGLIWLRQQQLADGDLRGRGRIYCHSMATLALTEAYAMSSDPALRDPAQRAITWLVQAQHPESGGWRYAPGQHGDTSVYGWCLLALRSATRAGLQVPEATWARARRWIPLVTSGPRQGLAAYRPGDLPSEAMTAEMIVCRQIFGAERNDPALDEGGDYLLTRLPSTGDYHLYYWYYGTLAMFQLGGTHWQRWNDALSSVLLETQRQSGHAKGSWDPQRPFGIDGGRVFTTACSALCLEVYYRYVPLYATSGKSASR